ncbi:MAG: hypothetical protein OQJ98_00605 [Candidatus Pacebacteria bacterium]|nr:hypothetical protein [Candidatus Paceibacterota bacterium]
MKKLCWKPIIIHKPSGGDITGGGGGFIGGGSADIGQERTSLEEKGI